MTTLVLDANVVLSWFGHDPGAGGAAERLRASVVAGEVVAAVPPLLFLEVVNVAARRWGWPAEDVQELAAALLALPWRVVSPPLAEVARWTGAGLTAYDAAYVALAESLGCRLVTADQAVLAAAPGIAGAW